MKAEQNLANPKDSTHLALLDPFSIKMNFREALAQKKI